MAVDWTHRAEYISKRDMTVDMANEALTDPNAVVIEPDYASKSGKSDRTIGWSDLAGRILTVITTAEEGVTYGVNCWAANDKDQTIYKGTR